MPDENPYQSPTTTPPSPTGKRDGRSSDIPPNVLVGLFLVGILQHWALVLLVAFAFLDRVPHPILSFATYFVHWSSVGGLIGFAVSKKGGRGPFIGAIAGALLSALLMC